MTKPQAYKQPAKPEYTRQSSVFSNYEKKKTRDRLLAELLGSDAPLANPLFPHPRKRSKSLSDSSDEFVSIPKPHKASPTANKAENSTQIDYVEETVVDFAPWQQRIDRVSTPELFPALAPTPTFRFFREEKKPPKKGTYIACGILAAVLAASVATAILVSLPISAMILTASALVFSVMALIMKKFSQKVETVVKDVPEDVLPNFSPIPA